MSEKGEKGSHLSSRTINIKRYVICSTLLVFLPSLLCLFLHRFPNMFLINSKPSYHRVFCLDRFDVQVVLRASGGAIVQYFVAPLGSLFIPCLVLPILSGSRWPGHKVTALFLGDVGLRSMDCLDVLPERTGICVALCAARDLAYIGFLRIQKYRDINF